MPFKSKDRRSSLTISPVLFMSVNGEPMNFFLCPGPDKVQLLPHIKAGGGLVCKAQQPGAILLIDPEEMGCCTESTAHWYVSTQYVRDCVKKNVQLDVEDYRLKPEHVKMSSGNQNVTKKDSARMSGGRTAYTTGEDAAIVSYVAKHKKDIKGNVLWKEMEKKNVTRHSWQSMKYRYVKKLSHTPVAEEEEKGKKGGDMEEENQETYIQNVTPESNAPHPETPSCSDNTTASDISQTDARPLPTESSPVEDVDPQTTNRPGPEVFPEVSPVLPESQPNTPSPQTVENKTKENAKPTDSSHSASPRGRSVRRKLEDSLSVLQPRKKTRSSPSPSQQKASSSPVKQPHPEKTTEEPPSPKEDGGERAVVMMENVQEEAVEASTSGEGDHRVTQKEAEKQGTIKEKRKLGNLEMAIKEFEMTESDNGAPDASDTEETAAEQPAQTSAAAASTSAAAPPSRPHLFIFEGESQEEDSQITECDDEVAPTDPQPIDGDAAVSLTQVQLEEDKQRIRALIQQTNKDLVSVTMALLKSSGDFSVARSLLLDPYSVSGPFWSRKDDVLLRFDDAFVRKQLQEKYGEEGVAKRLAFLEGD